ncbi:hypothetical protein FRC17_003176 [Serendipita sp. 399]|nr:hypothetical protein FRC17_003176 [Serendipita sp. 399]
MSCAGAPNKICGGPNAINIYVKDGFDYASGPARVLDSYNGYSKTQCWQDSTANRILKHGPAAPIPGESMTVEKCIDGCAAAGYSSAGVEYGGECFCDNVSYPPGPSGSMDECNMPCNGNGNEICGGASRILIYYKSPITATTTSTDSITPSVPTTTTTSTTTAPTETSTTSSLLQSETLIPSSTIPSTPSETPTPTFGATHEGLIEILSATTNAHIGYLAGIEDSGLVSFQRDVNLAKVYAFQVPEGGATTVTQTQIADTTSEGWFPLLGLIDGYGNPEPNIGTGSPNYLFLGGTSPSNPGEIPQYGPSSYDPEMSMFLAFESSVWSINMVTGDITPRWVNEDGSTFPTVLRFPPPKV